MLFCVTLCFTSIVLTQETFSARVVGVVDGDTITVLTKDKRQLMLRLADIDAPEKGQDFGVTSHQMLSGLILEQTVTVSGVKKDCLDRLTASVAFNKKDLSLSAVKSGNAWVDSSCQINEVLAKEELSAKEKKNGLWQNPNAVRPSEFVASKSEQLPVKTENSPARRIYSGIAPKPPASPIGLYIGMTLQEFVEICGEAGKRSSLTTTQYSQWFSLEIPTTKETAGKGCGGTFNFDRSTGKPNFLMTSTTQQF